MNEENPGRTLSYWDVQLSRMLVEKNPRMENPQMENQQIELFGADPDAPDASRGGSKRSSEPPTQKSQTCAAASTSLSTETPSPVAPPSSGEPSRLDRNEGVAPALSLEVRRRSNPRCLQQESPRKESPRKEIIGTENVVSALLAQLESTESERQRLMITGLAAEMGLLSDLTHWVARQERPMTRGEKQRERGNWT